MENTTNKRNDKVNKFFQTLLIALFVTRILTVGLFFVFKPGSEFIQRIINDPYHHYQIGLVLVVLSLLFRKKSQAYIFSALGVGIFLEELPVVLGDLGFNTSKYYHGGYDFIFVMLLTLALYLIVLKLQNT